MNKLLTLVLLVFSTSLYAASGDISDMKVLHHNNPNNNYFEVKIAGEFHQGQIFDLYINTDNDVSSGYGHNIGAEYLITTGWDIFKYIGPDGGSWDDNYNWDDYWQYQRTSDTAHWVNETSINIDLGIWELPALNDSAQFYIDTFKDNWDWVDWKQSGVTVGSIAEANDSQYVYQDEEIEFDISNDKQHIGIWRKSDSHDLISAYGNAGFIAQNNNALDVDYQLIKKTGGFDVKYTIYNPQDVPVQLPVLQVPGIKFGDTNHLKILNPLFRHYLEDRDLSVEKSYVDEDGNKRANSNGYFNVANFVRTINGKSYEGHYPYGTQFVYSPLILATNNNFAVGTSLNLDYTKRKYRLKPLMRIVKIGGTDWAYEYDLSQSKITGGDTLVLTLSVRFSEKDKWIFTIYPYKRFLADNLVGEDRKRPENMDIRPIKVVEMGGFNEGVGERNWSKDVLVNGSSVINLRNLLKTRGQKLLDNGFERAVFWNFTGLYDNNNNTSYGELIQQLPFQFVSTESPVLPEGMRLDMEYLETDNTNPFNQFAIGYDWGISGNIPVDGNGDVLDVNAWQPVNIVKFDLSNQNHKNYAQYYLDQAKNLKGLFKPKFIRLDAFVRMDVDNTKGYGFGMSRTKWLKHLQFSLPEVTFAAESSIDYMHARTADILQPDTIFEKDHNRGKNEERSLTQADFLAHYLNPGAETYVWLNTDRWFQSPQIKEYISSLISNGYTPLIDYWDVLDVKGIDTTVPACMDGKDNNQDGKIDWPYDAGCNDPSDRTEN